MGGFTNRVTKETTHRQPHAAAASSHLDLEKSTELVFLVHPSNLESNHIAIQAAIPDGKNV